MIEDEGEPARSEQPALLPATDSSSHAAPAVYLLNDRLIFTAARYTGAHSLSFGISMLMSLTSQPLRIRLANGDATHCSNAVFRSTAVTGMACDDAIASIQLYPASAGMIALSRRLADKDFLADATDPPDPQPLLAATRGSAADKQARLTHASDRLIEHFLEHPLQNVDIDDRVVRVRDTLLADPPRRVILGELARTINLSGDRLTHLFSAQTGTPLRSFALWCKASRAIEIFAQRPDADWASIAHEAGFSDLSHGIRTLKHFFGVSPKWVRGEDAPRFVFLNSENW